MNIKNNYKFNRSGFTILELIVYCAIFSIVIGSILQSIIWINSRMLQDDYLFRKRNIDIYDMYFANTYSRYKIVNSKIVNILPSIMNNKNLIYTKDIGSTTLTSYGLISSKIYEPSLKYSDSISHSTSTNVITESFFDSLNQ